MPFQIINDPNRSLAASLGAALGGGFGQGLGQGLEKRGQAQSLAQALGVTPKEALSYANLDPQVLKEVIKGKKLKNEENEFNNLSRLLFNNESYERPYSSEKFLGNESREVKKPSTKEMMDIITESKLRNIMGNNGLPQEQVSNNAPIINEEERILDRYISPTEKLNNYLSKYKGNISEKQYKTLFDRAQSEEAAHEKRFAATKEYRNAINNRAEAALRRKEDIEEQRALERSGKLDTPGYVEFLQRSGLDVPALLNPESQEFNKIVQNYLKDAKSLYGSQVTQYDVEQLLKAVPTLSNSRKGRERVLAALDRYADGELAYQQTVKQIMRENKGVPPLDLQEQVSERIGPKLKQIGKKFKEEIRKIQKMNIEEENSLVTAGQAILGNVVGGLGKKIPNAIKYGALGAGAGSALPGLGTGTGAGLGALYGLLS